LNKAVLKFDQFHYHVLEVKKSVYIYCLILLFTKTFLINGCLGGLDRSLSDHEMWQEQMRSIQKTSGTRGMLSLSA